MNSLNIISLVKYFLLILSLSVLQINSAAPDDDHHHQHHMMMSSNSVETISVQYQLPEISLTGMDGLSHPLKSILSTSEPVIVNYIFTSCTTICPVLSNTFSTINHLSEQQKQRIKLISISIDPEYDTPLRLTEYARKFKANKNWQFYTGKLSDIISLQKAMNVYRGSKMNHIPVSFIYQPAHDSWLRIDGFATAAAISRLYETLN